MSARSFYLSAADVEVWQTLALRRSAKDK